MAVTNRIEATLQADYFQFYLGGVDEWGGDDWAADGVDGLGYEWRLWARGRFAYVGTGGQHPVVDLTVEVHDAAPGEAGTAWDHVASTSIESDGTLGLWNWDAHPGPPPATVDFVAGTWRMRVHWAELASAGGEGPEAVTIQLWPEAWSETTLDRCWEPWRKPAPTDTSPDGRRQVELGEQIQLRCAHLEPVGSFEPPPPSAVNGFRRTYPPLPGGGPESACYRLKVDPVEGSWWAEGIDVRETVREVTVSEAADLRALTSYRATPDDHLQAWREHREAQRDR